MKAAALALLMAAAATAATAQPRGPLPSISATAPPSAMEQAPRLPEGQLQRFGTTGGDVHWLALDDLSRRGSLVEATVLTVLMNAAPRGGGPALLVVSREAIDCTARTSATYHAWYSADAILLDAVRAFEPKPLQQGSVSAMLAATVCDSTPRGEIVTGYGEALGAG